MVENPFVRPEFVALPSNRFPLPCQYLKISLLNHGLSLYNEFIVNYPLVIEEEQACGPEVLTRHVCFLGRGEFLLSTSSSGVLS
jgi:hypothetical protein